MKFKGIIKDFSQIVVSDPHYLQDVWCRFDRTFEKKEDWKVEFIIKEVDEITEYKGHELNIEGLDFSILIKREKSICKLIDIAKFQYKKGTEITDTEIGIDTAQVSMGVNEKAKEINEFSKKINKENAFEDIFASYNPSFAIQTMSDGLLGTVREGKIKGETDFIIIDGFFDECADVKTIEELKDYIVEQLEIEDLEIEKEIIEKSEEKQDINYDI